MENVKCLDFETKRKIMISFNKGIIKGHMNEKSISNLDKIFNKISYQDCDTDLFLCNLWLDIKLKIKKYYKKNKELLNRFLLYVNMYLCMLTYDIDFRKELLKEKGDYNEKRIY